MPDDDKNTPVAPAQQNDEKMRQPLPPMEELNLGTPPPPPVDNTAQLQTATLVEPQQPKHATIEVAKPQQQNVDDAIDDILKDLEKTFSSAKNKASPPKPEQTTNEKVAVITEIEPPKPQVASVSRFEPQPQQVVVSEVAKPKPTAQENSQTATEAIHLYNNIMTGNEANKNRDQLRTLINAHAPEVLIGRPEIPTSAIKDFIKQMEPGKDRSSELMSLQQPVMRGETNIARPATERRSTANSVAEAFRETAAFLHITNRHSATDVKPSPPESSAPKKQGFIKHIYKMKAAADISIAAIGKAANATGHKPVTQDKDSITIPVKVGETLLSVVKKFKEAGIVLASTLRPEKPEQKNRLNKTR